VHRRSINAIAKTDRFDIKLLKQAFLGWCAASPEYCTAAAIATIGEEGCQAT